MRLFLLYTFFSFSLLAAETENRHHLTVSGQGEVLLQADIADVKIGVEMQEQSAAAIQSALAEKVNTVLAKLRTLQTEKVETGTLQILPQYDKKTGQNLLGYKGVVAVQFSTAAANAGNLIDAAINAGANELLSVSLKPSQEKLREARLQALSLACKNALEEAEVILEALKLENRGVIEVTSEPNFSSGPQARSYGLTAMAKSMPVEITEQEQTIRASIQLQIQIP